MKPVEFSRKMNKTETLTAKIHRTTFGKLVQGARFWANDEMGPYYKTESDGATHYDKEGVFMFNISFESIHPVVVVTKELSKNC